MTIASSMLLLKMMLMLALCALAVPAVAASLYLLLLTLLSTSPRAPQPSSRRLRFDVIIPAHNEALIIADAIRSVRRLDWPTDGYRVIVVADNCTDVTAAVARAAGADVLERNEPARRGKGYALDFAFQDSLACGWADAVVVIDADSRVSVNLLEAFAARIETGAGVLQAHYGVLNAKASWRTRLMSIALGAFHRLRSRARERLGLSCGIRGNGWCITHALLRNVPYRAFSLTEDLEYGIDLGLAGHRVHGVDEAQVDATMVIGEQASRSQRQRWESGRWQLIRTRSLLLLRAAVPRRRVPLDLAFDLLVMPLSYVVANIVLLIVLAGLATLWNAAFAPWFWVGVACAGCVASYVLRGWQLSDVGLRGFSDLLRAPLYILWKFALMVRTHAPAEWVRTKREDA
jgi:cellulose synthase/poly-beta-1,6-N-acetylglucosamine synthase-like glycosyltransferase